jgi:hypothetical protein
MTHQDERFVIWDLVDLVREHCRSWVESGDPNASLLRGGGCPTHAILSHTRRGHPPCRRVLHTG